MRKRLFNLAAKLTTLAMVLGMLTMASPVSAVGATSISDTMSRLQINQTSVTHAVTMSLATAPSGGTLILTYTGFSAFAFTSGTCTGGTVTNNGTATNVVNVTLASCTSGTVTLNFTGTNPSTTGSKSVAISGTSGITGSYAVSIVNSDQVTVSATVDPALTFNVYANTTHTDNSTYLLPLGTLVSGSVTSSNDSSIRSIWLDVDTNASGGAVVTVLNANGSSGLKSTSTPADFIANAATTMAAGTANYGLCVASVTQTTGTLAKGTNYSSLTPCTAGGAGNQTAALSSSTADPIINTSGAPIAGGYAEVLANAAISGVTPAHNDYTDILTFIATGTF